MKIRQRNGNHLFCIVGLIIFVHRSSTFCTSHVTSTPADLERERTSDGNTERKSFGRLAESSINTAQGILLFLFLFFFFLFPSSSSSSSPSFPLFLLPLLFLFLSLLFLSFFLSYPISYFLILRLLHLLLLLLLLLFLLILLLLLYRLCDRSEVPEPLLVKGAEGVSCVLRSNVKDFGRKIIGSLSFMILLLLGS